MLLGNVQIIMLKGTGLGVGDAAISLRSNSTGNTDIPEWKNLDGTS